MTDNFEAEVVWQSEGKTPDGNPFMTVKQARGYYYYAERGGKDSIAFILYDSSSEKPFGLIYESKPPMDETRGEKVMMTTAFGGSNDMKASFEEICQIEVLEEAGYKVSLDAIVSCGTTLVSTQMSQGCVGFIVDVTGLEAGKTEADIKNEAQEAKDPDEFCNNKVAWMNLEEVMSNNDWKSIWITSKVIFSSIKNQYMNMEVESET